MISLNYRIHLRDLYASATAPKTSPAALYKDAYR